MDHAKYTLVAEPPSPRGIEQFHTDSPAFLLTKVDGDELLNLLESQPATPFESPRLESQLSNDFEESIGANDISKTKKAARARIKTGPRPISGRPDAFVSLPKRIDNDQQLPLLQKHKDDAAAQRDESDSDSYLQGAWQDFGGAKWSVSHAKILLLISKYTGTPKDADSSVWLRQLHLIAMIHEGICAGVLCLRYSPSSTLVFGQGEPSRIWLNVSSAGSACLNDLCRGGLVHCLRIPDSCYAQSTAYQISTLGAQFVQVMPDDLKIQLDSFLRGPHPFNKEIIEMEISEQSIAVTTKGGYNRTSSILDCERIPFVTSPYVPIFLRSSDKPCTDNTALASQCALWNQTPSENKVVSMCFGNITITLSEYLPIGPNMIQSLSETLGSRDRSQKSDGNFMLPCRLNPDRYTTVSLLDCQVGSYTNYEGVISTQNFNNPTTRHIEEFGIHLNQDGTVVCGLQVEAVTDRDWDDISLDLISKLIRELQDDSSIVVDNVYPEMLYTSLECLFFGKESSRTKYVCLIADLIEPKLPAKQYLDKGKYESELASIVGDLSGAEDLGEGDMVFFGSRGFFVIGPNAREHEPICVSYSSLVARNIFLDQFFRRASCLSDSLVDLHELLRNVDADQEVLQVLNTRIMESSSSFRILSSTLGHFVLALESYKVVERPKNTPGRVFFDLMRLRSLQKDLLDRAEDMKILLCRIDRELVCLTELASFEERKNLERCFYGLQRQTLHLGREKGSLITHSGAMVLKSNSALKLLIVCFAGLLASDILDRLHSGVLMNSTTPEWFSDSVGNLNAHPYLLFFLQMLVIATFCIVVSRRSVMFESRTVCFVRRRLDLNLKVIDMAALFKFLDKKHCDSIIYDAKVHDHSSTNTSTWAETGMMRACYKERKAYKWYGDPPKVTLAIDVINCWVKSAEYSWGFWADAPTKAKLKEQLQEALVKAGVIENP